MPLAGATSVVCPLHSGDRAGALQRVIGLFRRRAGLPMMSDGVLVVLNAA